MTNKEGTICNFQPKLVILGAGRPHGGDLHASLRNIDTRSRVLDWTFAAFSGVTDDIHFVGGYEIENIMQHYPNIHISANPRWKSTGSVGSLFTMDLSPAHDYFVSYSDIVFRPELVKKMLCHKEDIVVAVDSKWKSRYKGRSEAEMLTKERVCTRNGILMSLIEQKQPTNSDNDISEFLGLAFFPRFVIPCIRELAVNGNPVLSDSNLGNLIEHLSQKGFQIRTVDVQGEWAEINYPGDLAQFILGTKAQTLDRLSKVIKKSQMPEQISFNLRQWNDSPDIIVDKIQIKFCEQLLAVRSSAITEDGFQVSNAGAYTSLLNIRCENRLDLYAAIETVFKSYPDKTLEHQILVQPMLKDVKISGVVFTRTLDFASPYYTIEYDSVTGYTNTVTQGSLQKQESLTLMKTLQHIPPQYQRWISCLIGAVKEIEELVGYDALDIEFAVDSGDTVFILQVRPIVTTGRNILFTDDEIEKTLDRSKKHYRQKKASHPLAKCKSCVFGVMPDWNPAEIIGTRPRMLASTLYQYLITDNTWAKQRAEFGYRDVRPYPLMHFFAGHPYIDTRASFHSFIPAALPDALAESLTDFYLSWLIHHPELHDKVEFEVLPTCYSFSFDLWEARLRKEGKFSAVEIKSLEDALRDVTNGAFARYRMDLQSIDILLDRFLRIQKSDLSPLNKAMFLLYDCREFGALPFAHLARGGFIAVTLLRSAVQKGWISVETMEAFLNSIDTITNGLARDAVSVKEGKTDWFYFVEKYGHLRPGTYEITSPSYGEEPAQYLRPLVDAAVKKEQELFVWPDDCREKIEHELHAHGLKVNFDQWETFLREAIKGREYSKFAFSRNLSSALQLITIYGKSMGFSTDELSFVSFRALQDAATGHFCTYNEIDFLKREVTQNRREWELACAIELPPLITDETDFDIFKHFESQPNFIGTKKIIAPLLFLMRENINSSVDECSGRIVVIPQADPGYDWLFGQPIAALITMYGGANSHMAIRAAEFGLPAAIGIGEKLYKKLTHAKILELDCGSRRIKVIR